MEQRKFPRFFMWFPVRIVQSEAKAQLGVTHNVSQQGFLLVSSKALGPNETITIAYRTSPQDPEKLARGRIVRVDRNEEDPDGLWPYRMAVEFEQPLEGLETLLESTDSQVMPQS